MDADLYEQLQSTITTSPRHSGGMGDASTNDQLHSKDADTVAPSSLADESSEPRERTSSSNLPQEIDQVVQAISSSPWAAKLGTFMESVKKQSESVLETTKERATKEFDHVRSGLASFTSPQPSTMAENGESMEESDSAKPDEKEAKTSRRLSGSVMFSYLKSTADAAQKRITPALSELSKAEDVADAYLNRLGASFGQLLKDAVTIVPPEESTSLRGRDGDVLFDTSLATKKKKHIHTSRSEAVLHALHIEPTLFLDDSDLSEEDSYSLWQSSFSAEKHTEEIAALLDRYPELRSQMDAIVPERVSYKDFWSRYLYRKSKIDSAERKRKQLFENKVEENDFDWDEEDESDVNEEETEDVPTRQGKASMETVTPGAASVELVEPAPRNSRSSESSTSFDIVSQSSAIPPQSLDKMPQATEESDDDDWE